MKILAFLAGLCLATPVVARDATVQSGEHAEFTRLVVESGVSPVWDLSQDDRKAQLSIAGVSNYQIADVYRFIPRTRLAGISSNDDRLELELGCDCMVEAFEHQGRYVVLDIRAKSTAAASVTDDENIAARPTVGLPVVFDTALPVTEPPNLPDGVDVSAFRTELAGQLARAAGQGLVLAPSAQANTEPAAPSPAPPPDISVAAPEALVPQPQIVVRTRVDLDNPVRQQATQSSEGLVCPTSKLLRFSEERAELTQAIAQARRSLYGEFDRPNRAAAEMLAKAYFQSGFGAEAAMVLALPELELPDRALLLEIARQMDTPARKSPQLARFAGCDTEIAPWAILAAKVDDLQATAIPESLAITISGYALPLRRQIGPPLAAHLLSAGHQAQAEAVRATLARADGPHGSAFDLADARLAAAREGAQLDPAVLLDIARRDDQSAPEAFERLLDQAIETNTSVDAKTSEAIDALAFELRGTEIGNRLARKSLLAQAQGDSSAHAMVLAMSSEEFRSDRGLVDKIASAFVAETTDATFLRTLYDADLVNAHDHLTMQHQGQIADRLMDLGLPDLAAKFLPVSANPDPDLRIRMARLALMQNQPTKALLHLGDLEGPAAKGIRDAATSRREMQAETDVRAVQAPEPDRPDAALPRDDALQAARAALETARALRAGLEPGPAQGGTGG